MVPEQEGGNILIVDDTPDNLRLLTRQLSGQGYKVRPAPSGSHALVTARKELPDLILLDIMMPEMDGYEVCRLLKEDEATALVPVIFLSALGEVEDKMKGFEVGGVDYITKPFHEREVLARVETHLKIRRLQKRLEAETLRFKTLSEATFEGIVIHADSRVVDLNSSAARLFGQPVRQLIDSRLDALFLPELQQKIVSGVKEPFEGEIVRQDQSRLAVELQTSSLPLNDLQAGVIAIRDLSLQKRMEEEKVLLEQENTVLKKTMKDRYKFGDIIGRSPAMQLVYELISKAAASSFPVVISGESGTGKELVAKTIHALTGSGNAPFITVNCGAVTESLFEREFFGHRKGAFTDAVRDEPGYFDAAHRGTLFLDEVGDLPMAMQVKLLRVLESGEYTPVGAVIAKKAEVRVITATNKDLDDLVRQGKFREDLFYRIHVIEIRLPPLRERREDIRLLVEFILERHNAADKMDNLPEKLKEMLYNYEWPGNVRELMNTIQRFLATDHISLPGNRQAKFADESRLELGHGLHGAVESLEKRMIGEALEQTGWHRGETAKLLDIPRRSLQRKMKKYQYDEPV